MSTRRLRSRVRRGVYGRPLSTGPWGGFGVKEVPGKIDDPGSYLHSYRPSPLPPRHPPPYSSFVPPSRLSGVPVLFVLPPVVPTVSMRHRVHQLLFPLRHHVQYEGDDLSVCTRPVYLRTRAPPPRPIRSAPVETQDWNPRLHEVHSNGTDRESQARTTGTHREQQYLPTPVRKVVRK